MQKNLETGRPIIKKAFKAYRKVIAIKSQAINLKIGHLFILANHQRSTNLQTLLVIHLNCIQIISTIKAQFLLKIMVIQGRNNCIQFMG